MKQAFKTFLAQAKRLILPSSDKLPDDDVTNNRILAEMIECFSNSLKKESVGTSLLFDTYFIILLHPEAFESRLASFPIIVKEAVKAFYKKLNQAKAGYDEVSPVSSKWNFRFGPAVAFNNEKIEPGDIKVIGMLTGEKDMGMQHKTKVTLKPKRSNIYDRMDINLEAIRNIDFQDGSFVVKFDSTLQVVTDDAPKSLGGNFAQIDYFIGDKNIEETYLMKDREIVIARKEPENKGYSNYLLIDSSYVSNPHARIRYNPTSAKFEIASFSRNETRVNERVIPQSELASPQWFDLRDNSQILLNGIITLTFQKTQ